jgi:hypothetical protein
MAKSVAACSGVQVATDFECEVSGTKLGGSWPPTQPSL